MGLIVILVMLAVLDGVLRGIVSLCMARLAWVTHMCRLTREGSHGAWLAIEKEL